MSDISLDFVKQFTERATRVGAYRQVAESLNATRLLDLASFLLGPIVALECFRCRNRRGSRTASVCGKSVLVENNGVWTVKIPTYSVEVITVPVSDIEFSIEVITVPVSDVERALRFYVDQVGFMIDVDYWPNDSFRVVQIMPPGSNCALQIGEGLTNAPAGSLRNVFLIVTDLEATRRHLLERGVKVSEIRHKTPVGAWDGGFAPGLDPSRGDYASLAEFSDPDGNRWVLQERGYQNA